MSNMERLNNFLLYYWQLMRAEAKLHIPSTIKSRMNLELVCFWTDWAINIQVWVNKAKVHETQFLCQIITILFIVLGIYNFGHRLRLVTKTGGSLYGIFRRHRRQTKAGNYYFLSYMVMLCIILGKNDLVGESFYLG